MAYDFESQWAPLDSNLDPINQVKFQPLQLLQTAQNQANGTWPQENYGDKNGGSHLPTVEIEGPPPSRVDGVKQTGAPAQIPVEHWGFRLELDEYGHLTAVPALTPDPSSSDKPAPNGHTSLDGQNGHWVIEHGNSGLIDGHIEWVPEKAPPGDAGKLGQDLPGAKENGHSIPDWQRDKENAAAAKEAAQRAAEETQKAADAAKAAQLEKEAQREAQQKHDTAMEKAKEAGAFAPEVLQELAKQPPAEGVQELVNKILEGYGGPKATSHFDHMISSRGSQFPDESPASWFAEGADKKFAAMTPAEAASALKKWETNGQNPLEPGGVLEQRLVEHSFGYAPDEVVSFGGSIPHVPVTTDRGVYDPRHPLKGTEPDLVKSFKEPQRNKEVEKILRQFGKHTQEEEGWVEYDHNPKSP